jgi:hypothetical protein
MLQRCADGLALIAIPLASGSAMPPALSDEEAGRQILGIFVRYRVQAGGTLRRTHFFDVRDGDFQRGLNNAIANKWMAVHHRDRYRYILTEEGYAAGRRAEDAAKEPAKEMT